MGTKVSDRRFVEAWLSSDGVQQCAEFCEMKPSGVAARARRLRSAGVNLPKFARPAKQVDVDGLNALIGGQGQ